MTTASRPRRSPGPPAISERALNRTTLLRQSLLQRAAGSPADAIHGLAGLQAQYANAPYIALWSRLVDFEIEALEAALDERTVVKASAVRNTLHLVAAEDYPPFIAASSVARVANWRPSAKRAGIDTEALHQRMLAFASEPRTIAELETNLETLASDASLAPFVPSGVRHVAFQMASAHGWLVHAPPSGRWDAFDKPRYVDAGVWLPKAKRPEPDEALRITIERYLGAFGPASIADVGRWLGQPRPAPIREAVDALADRIRRFQGPDERELIDLANAPLATGDEDAPVRFLARWDSMILGYEVRDRILPAALAPTVIKKNADILATFTVDGLVAGTWSVATSAGATTLEVAPAAPVAKAAKSALTDEAERLVRFIARDGGTTEVRWR